MFQTLALKRILSADSKVMKIQSLSRVCGLSLLHFASTRAFCPSPQPSSLHTLSTAVQPSSVEFSKPTTFARTFHRTSVVVMAERKAGVSSPEELKAFVKEAGDKLLVVDVRNPDADVEPGDQKSLAVAALPSETNRPQATHLIWDRNADSMPLPEVPKDTPIITHCGGGGRGQKAKDFLMKNGFTKVLNGGGPKETDCWAEYGNK